MLVAFYVVSWLEDDLEELGMYKKTIHSRNAIFGYAFQIAKSHRDWELRKKYIIALSIFLSAPMVMLFSGYKAVGFGYAEPCENYADYIDYSVEGVVSYKVKGRRSDPVGIYFFNSGFLDPCAYPVSNLYEYLNSGDHVKKAKGDSIIHVTRANVDSSFIGTRKSFDCHN
jgi:hypothetical protein